MGVRIVLGGLFGDEGKGLVVDHLCALNPGSQVIRFSGGHQAGHTVHKDGISHVFANFGSGTLRRSPTYWSEYCTVEPVGLLRELNLLKEKGIDPVLYINAECPITTPYDIVYDEYHNRSNTCGVGFGSTLQREESFYSLKFLDLFYPQVLTEKLKNIKEYYSVYSDVEFFVEACSTVIASHNIKLVMGLPHYSDDYIFEGSQGLLLDQHFGFFPNVTRSNTGCKNAVAIMEKANIMEDYNVYVVTRAYQTRHGAGFMTNENIPHNILKNPLETNITNEFQGSFRRSLLDVSLLEYAIKKDAYIRQASRVFMVITCLDHVVNDYRFTYKNHIINCSDEFDFVTKICAILNIKNMYISRSNESKNVHFYKEE